jgi:hypothetical protein
MNLFGFGKPSKKPIPSYLRRESAIPVRQFDLSKRYDLHCSEVGHDRVFENVRFLGLCTFEPISEYGTIIGGYLELEAEDGSRIMIPHYQIRLICEHGMVPKFRVLRHRRPHSEHD